jgi:hypothetical protein
MSTDAVREAAEENIRNILMRPRMWGAGDEAVELQVLMSLEFRELTRSEAARRDIRKEYKKFLAATFGSSQLPIFARNGMTTKELVEHLNRFVELMWFTS